MVSSGEAASCNSDSRLTIPGSVGHRSEIEWAVALAASPLARTSFRMIFTRARAMAVDSVLTVPRSCLFFYNHACSQPCEGANVSQGQTLDFQSTALPTELPSRHRRRPCDVSWGSHYATIPLQGKAAQRTGNTLTVEIFHSEICRVVWLCLVPVRGGVIQINRRTGELTVWIMQDGKFTG